MGTRQVSIRADEGLFLGLAKQNMLFHQCIFELCDKQSRLLSMVENPISISF